MDANVAALLIAALSLVLAGLSLGWQIAHWLLSAGRPKATLMHGVMQGSGAYVGPVGKNGTGLDLPNLRRQGIDGPATVGIQVTNHGHVPVVVETVAMVPRGGVMRFVPVDQWIGPAPHTVEPGSNASWYMTADPAIRLVQSSREVLHENVNGVYMTAQLGTDRTIETPRSMRLNHINPGAQAE